MTPIYRYDSFGNRTEKIYDLTDLDHHEGKCEYYNYDGNNRITRVIGADGTFIYSHDANGNMISDGQNSYSYNSRNQLEEFDDGSSVSTYGYAPTGLRRSKSVSFGGGTYENFSYTYDNGNLIFEYYSNHFYSPRTCIGTYYNYGPTGIISQSNLNTDENDGAVVDNSIIFEKDAHGDVIYKLNASDYSLLTYDSNYDAFGNGGNRSYSNLGYCGEYFDNESGLIYLRARYYNPKTGRFISEDPIRDGLNWYVYCENNPVNRWDPSGMAVTQEDIANLSSEQITQIERCTREYEAAEAIGDYVGMSRAHNRAAEIRQSTYEYIDEFDYTFGGKLYTQEYIYNEFHITHHDGSGEFTEKTGNVYILKLESDVGMRIKQAESQSIFQNDYIVLDFRYEKNPNMQVRNSYETTDNQIKSSIIDILLEYESKDPSQWKRSKEKMMQEWIAHNAVYYLTWGKTKERARHVDLDNAGENKLLGVVNWR